MPDPIDERREDREHVHRKLSRKERALKDARGHRDWLRMRRIPELEANVADAKQSAREHPKSEQAASHLIVTQQKLHGAHKEYQATLDSIHRLERIVPHLRELIRKATAWIKRALRNRRQRRRKRRREEREEASEIVFTSGPVHWAGCEDIINQECDPVAAEMGYYEVSGKRPYPLGNPNSDHYTLIVIASARDYLTGVALAIAIARSLGVPYYGYAQDYQLFYIQREGHLIRVQIIAQNHGTGPHNHVGLRFVS